MVPIAVDPLLLLVAGLVIDALFGDMPMIFRHIDHPVVVAGRAIAFFDRKLNRQNRSETSRRDRGIVTVILLVAAAATLGLAIQRLCRGHLLGAVFEALLMAVLVAQRSLYDHVAAVAEALDAGGLAAGRAAVRHIVGRDPMSLDTHGVARAAIESLAENFSDGVVAPVFWYLLLGLPGLFAYKMANTFDSMIGHRTPHYRSFGWAAARFDDFLNLVPAPISGLLLAAGAVLASRCRPDRALVIMIRDGRKHHSPNAGWPESAIAGALGLALAGPRRYPEGLVDDPWLGDGSARAATSDIVRALHLYRLACLIEGGLLVAAWIALHLTPII
ncbi:MAG TPA: adenosylcobinamide-phosphate synthase CbiB [Stellaceae bacterium]|jgi:adenosylcobinamide-phosphate synthase|nr:adenosylcobinamide-phosphate synthase CbiB [Stellaceae bacterium]